MKKLSFILAIPFLAFSQQELGFTLGGLTPKKRSARPADLESGGGLALQANYAVAAWNKGGVALLPEVHFLASPLRNVTSANPLAVRDYASLYITPGLRMKFGPEKALSPWIAAGFGYAQYHSSELLQNGASSPVRDRQNTYAGNFGGGVDVRLGKRLSLRGEIRDFISPNPRFNVAIQGSQQHNLVIGGGIVLRFGGE